MIRLVRIVSWGWRNKSLKNEKFHSQSAKKCARHICDNHLGVWFKKGFSCALSSCWMRPYSAGEMD